MAGTSKGRSSSSSILLFMFWMFQIMDSTMATFVNKKNIGMLPYKKCLCKKEEYFSLPIRSTMTIERAVKNRPQNKYMIQHHQHQKKRMLRLTAVVDPNEFTQCAASLSDMIHSTCNEGAGAGATSSDHHFLALISTMISSATALDPSQQSLTMPAEDISSFLPEKAEPHYMWNFFGWHGNVVQSSIPPAPDSISSTSSASTQDYFIPSIEDQQSLQKALQQKEQALSTGIFPRDIVGKIITNPTGTNAPPPNPFMNIPKEIAGDDESDVLNLIDVPGKNRDIYELIDREWTIFSRLPLLATTYVMIDFFFLNSGNDLFRDEWSDQNHREDVAVDWIMQVGRRFIIAIFIAIAATIWNKIMYTPDMPPTTL